MTTSQYTEINTREPNWQREAARLAKLKLPFVVTGFNASLDKMFVDALAKKFGFNVTIDPVFGQAYFKATDS